jgi:tRNA (guanine-N7-)-methyltransferase
MQEDLYRKRDSEFMRSFVRRGRKLSLMKEQLCQQILPQHKEKISDIFMFKDHQPINFEIGFGSGDFLASIALIKPNEIFIGCEPYKQGLANLLENIVQNGIANVLLWNDDARLLLQQIPDRFLTRVFILFPDPWHKVKHYKRRIINKDLLDLLAKKISLSGRLFIATDHEDYKNWIIDAVEKHNSFKTASASEWKELGYVNTHYRNKAMKKNINSWFGCFYIEN